MKIKAPQLLVIAFALAISGCSYTYSNSGKPIDFGSDSEDLAIAKISLHYLEVNQEDSLLALFIPEVADKVTPKQMEMLSEQGRTVLTRNQYPADSLVTVSNTTRKTNTGKTTYKEFNFPFINQEYPDSTMYFKVTLVEGEIYRLFLSTGMRIQKVEE